MKIYEDRNKKREIQCNYCYGEGHNKRNCPTMKAHWDANKHLDPETAIHDDLVGVDNSMFPKYYQSYWGDQIAHRQYFNHLTYMTKRFAPKSETNTKKRKKASKCGFCGSKAHTRRNCNKMKNFVYVLNETNKAFRSQFYDRFIEGMGLGAGALVEQRMGDRWNVTDKSTVAIITEFPTDSIMFTNVLYRWSDYHTPHRIATLPNGSRFAMDTSQGVFFDKYMYENGANHDRSTELYGEFAYMYTGYGMIKKIVSPAPNRPSKEWFMGQSPCFDFIVKKRKIDQLMYDLGSTIKKFYPHDNLRSKLGAKIYDQYWNK